MFQLASLSEYDADHSQAEIQKTEKLWQNGVLAQPVKMSPMAEMTWFFEQCSWKID